MGCAGSKPNHVIGDNGAQYAGNPPIQTSQNYNWTLHHQPQYNGQEYNSAEIQRPPSSQQGSQYESSCYDSDGTMSVEQQLFATVDDMTCNSSENGMDLNEAYMKAEMLLRKGARANSMNVQGLTPLHIAAIHGYEFMVELLIRHGANVNLRSRWNDAPLHLAVRYGHVGCVQSLVNVPQIDLNAKDKSNNAAIHEAIMIGVSADEEEKYRWLQIINLLIGARALLDQCGGDGTTAMHLIALHGLHEPVENAIQIDIKLPLSIVDEQKNTPIHLAARYGHYKVVRLMMNLNPSLADVLNADGQTPLSLAAASMEQRDFSELKDFLSSLSPMSFDSSESECFPPPRALGNIFIPGTSSTDAHKAAFLGHANAIEQLINAAYFETDSIVCSRDDNGDTPLHIACSRGKEVVTKILLGTRSGYEVAVSSRNHQGFTPMHLAVYENNLNIVQILMNAKSRHSSNTALNAKDVRGNTPVHVATWKGNLIAIRLLLVRGANVNAINNFGQTPLLVAMKYCNAENVSKVIKLLVDCGANPEKSDKKNVSPLSLCQRESSWYQDHIGKCMALLQSMVFKGALEGEIRNLALAKQFGAHMDEFNSEGETAIHAATKAGHLPLISWLKTSGVNLNVANRKKEYPIHIACLHGYYGILEILLDVPNEIERHRLTNAVSGDGDTPLHVAAKGSSQHVVELLIAHGASVDALCERQSTPLHDAICENATEIVETLLRAGANPNKQEGLGGNTPMHLLVLWGSRSSIPKLATMLKHKGADLSIKNDGGYTAEALGVLCGNTLLFAEDEQEMSPEMEISTLAIPVSSSLDSCSSAIDLGDAPDIPSLVPMDFERQGKSTLASFKSAKGRTTQSPFSQCGDEDDGRDHQNQPTVNNGTERALQKPPSFRFQNAVPPSPFHNAICVQEQEKDEHVADEEDGPGFAAARQGLVIKPEQLTIRKDKKLGQGSFGVVYLGILHYNKVAIKIVRMHDHESGGEKQQKMHDDFLQELKTLHSLRHDNVQDVRGFVECLEDQGPAIVSKYYEKGSLSDLLIAAKNDAGKEKAKALTWDRRLLICMDIARGLVYLHSKSPPMIHQDVKAANCFIDENYRACVGDFGFSKQLHGDERHTYNKPSNPRWLAPELFNNESKPSCSSDTYGFGMVLYEVLTFSPPYGRLQYIQVFNQVSQGEKPKLPLESSQIPGILQDNEIFESSGAFLKFKNLIQQCWRNDYENRPPMGQVHDTLEEIYQLYKSEF